MADKASEQGVSRRRFVSAAATSALFAPALGAMAQATSPITPPAQTPQTASPIAEPAISEPVDVATLAAQTDAAKLLTVGVMVNGRGPYRFVVDTGSERSVLSDRVVKQLGLSPSGKAIIDGVVLKVSADLVMVKELAFGPFSRTDLELPVLPYVNLLADGFLGLDAIRGSRVTFDFRNHALKIEQPRRNDKAFDDNGGDVIIVRATGSAGRLRTTDCTVDGIRTTVFIDTGAQVSIGNPALRTALERRYRSVTELGNVGLQGVTGGELVGKSILIKEIRMRDLLFADGSVVIADVSIFNDWELANKPALMLGMDFLRQFGGVSIDYRKKEILFEMSALSNDRSRLQRLVGV